MKLPAFELERFFAKYEFTAPCLLSSSDCEAMTIEELLNLESDAAQNISSNLVGLYRNERQP